MQVTTSCQEARATNDSVVRDDNRPIPPSDDLVMDITNSVALNKTPGTLPWGLDRPLKRDYAVTVLFFLRQPSRPNPTKPVAKSGRAPGRGTFDTETSTGPVRPPVHPV